MYTTIIDVLRIHAATITKPVSTEATLFYLGEGKLVDDVVVRGYN